jgi:hypothetical protein
MTHCLLVCVCVYLPGYCASEFAMLVNVCVFAWLMVPCVAVCRLHHPAEGAWSTGAPPMTGREALMQGFPPRQLTPPQSRALSYPMTPSSSTGPSGHHPGLFLTPPPVGGNGMGLLQGGFLLGQAPPIKPPEPTQGKCVTVNRFSFFNS